MVRIIVNTAMATDPCQPEYVTHALNTSTPHHTGATRMEGTGVHHHRNPGSSWPESPFMMAGIRLHDHPESMFTIPRNRRSSSAGTRTLVAWSDLSLRVAPPPARIARDDGRVGRCGRRERECPGRRADHHGSSTPGLGLHETE